MDALLGSLIVQLLWAGHQLDNLAAKQVYASELHNPLTVEELKQYAETTALRHNVAPGPIFRVIQCESGWVSNARGDNGLARGLVQIRSDYWPEISDAEADDPYFAINFIVKKFAEGREELWSCARLLGLVVK